MLSEWAVMADAEGPVVNWYGPSRVSFRLDASTRLTLVQETRYPAEGAVKLTVRPERAAKFSLRLRIPQWSAKTQVSVDGEPVPDVRPGTYHAIDRLWAPGDTVEMVLDMTPRHLIGEQEKAGKASLYRGPLLLAFDEHHNAYGCGSIPRLDLQKLELKGVPLSDAFPPTVLFEVASAEGRPIRLCDFATAGAHGSRYRSCFGLSMTSGRERHHCQLRAERRRQARARPACRFDKYRARSRSQRVQGGPCDQRQGLEAAIRDPRFP